MLTKEQLDSFNRILSTRFGLMRDGVPLFRLSWTTNQTEVVRGEHDVVTDSGIWLRREYGEKRVLRYPGVPDRYVLEIFQPAPPELPEKPYTYEGIWFFQDKDGNYLEPVELAMCYVAKNYLMLQGNEELTEAVCREMSEEEDKRAEDYFFEVLDNEVPYLPLKMSMGEAVAVPGRESGDDSQNGC